MAPTITSQIHTLIENQEVSFGTITSPTGFDFVDAFVDGTGNPNASAEFRLYEIVGGQTTLVATAPGGGLPSVLDWGSGGAARVDLTRSPPAPSPYSPAEGAGFTFELRAIFFGGGPPPNFLCSLVGYDEFDVTANTDSGLVTVQVPNNFTEITIATLPGYAQFLDVSVTEGLPNAPVRFAVYAQAGVGGVLAEVAHLTVQGTPPNGPAERIMSPLKLPGATSYILKARLDSAFIDFPPLEPQFVSAGMTTHSQSVSVGGVVTLTGNVNGPSNANRWTSLVLPNTNAAPVTTIPFLGTVPGDGWWYVAVTSIGPIVDRTVNLPAAPTAGEVVVITDEDGILTGANTITVNGAPNDVEGVSPFVMNAAYPGQFGSICLQFDGTAWFIFADYAPNAASSIALAGNANGPAGANDVVDFGIESTDASVVAGQFVPISSGEWYVGMNGLTANRAVQLDDAFPPGSKVTVKDEDGSLAGFDIAVTGSTGKTIDGNATYTMDVASPGPFGAVRFEKNFHAPNEWSVVVL